MAPVDAALVAVSGVLVVVGVVFIARAHRSARRGQPSGIALAGVGRLSAVTVMVTGLALAGVGYHVGVHALGFVQFRAPLPIAIGVAVVAVVCSMGMDAHDNGRGDG